MTEKKTFHLLVATGPDPIAGRYWCERHGLHWFSEAHGYLLYGEEVLDTVEAASARDLDWSRAEVRREGAVTGWLAPDGTHHGCNGTDHGALTWVMGTTEAKLDADGWVRISACRRGAEPFEATFALGWSDEKARPTPEQAAWLRKRRIRVPLDSSNVTKLVPPRGKR